MTLSLLFLNIANIVYVICYLVKDVLLLRIMAVTAMLLILPFYCLHSSEPMYEPLLWNALFMSINIFWIAVIFRQRQKPRLTPIERELYEKTFNRVCSERDMLKILESSEWKEFQPGDVLVEANTNPAKLILVQSGVADVIIDGKPMVTLTAGDLVAEMSFITGNPAVADVVACSTTSAVVWPAAALRKMFASRPDLQTTVYQLIGHDLVGKLGSVHEKVPELSVSLSADSIHAESVATEKA